MKIFKILCCLISAVALLVTGCSAGQDKASSSNENIEIGIVTFSAADVAISKLVAGAQEEAKNRGFGITLIDANGTPDQANSGIQNLVQKKVDAIIVTVFAATALQSGIDAASAAGIPVLMEGGGKAPGVAYNLDDSLGTPLTEEMVGQLPEDSTVFMLNYRGGRPCQLREEGFDKVVQTRPDLNIQKQEVPVPGQTEAARSATLAWLASTEVKPGATAIWTCFDDIGLGAISALKEQNVKDVMVFSANGIADALQAVEDGWLHTTMWINLEQGGRDMVNKVPEILKAGESWEYEEVPAKYEMVNSKNVKEFWAEHPEIK